MFPAYPPPFPPPPSNLVPVVPGMPIGGLPAEPKAEEQIILRVPPNVAEVLDKFLESGGEDEPGCFIRFYEDGCALLQPAPPKTDSAKSNQGDGKAPPPSSQAAQQLPPPPFPALRGKLVDLPCVVETYRTYTSDASTVYKSGDIRQMLVIEGGQEPDFARANRSIAPGLPKMNHAHKRRMLASTPTFEELCRTGQYPHGLTMPALDIRKRVYEKQNPRIDPKCIEDIECRIRIQLRAPGQVVSHEAYTFVPKSEAEAKDREIALEQNKYFQPTPTPASSKPPNLRLSLSRNAVKADLNPPTPVTQPSLTLKLSPSAVAMTQTSGGGAKTGSMSEIASAPTAGAPSTSAQTQPTPGKFVFKLGPRVASGSGTSAPVPTPTQSGGEAAGAGAVPLVTPTSEAARQRLQSGERAAFGGQTPRTDLDALNQASRGSLSGSLEDEEDDMRTLARVQSTVMTRPSPQIGFTEWGGDAAADSAAAAAAAAAADAAQAHTMVRATPTPLETEEDDYQNLAMDFSMPAAPKTIIAPLAPLPSVGAPMEAPSMTRQVSAYDPFAGAQFEMEQEELAVPQPASGFATESVTSEPVPATQSIPPHLMALHEEVQRCQQAVARAREAVEQAPNIIVKRRKQADLDAAEAKLKEALDRLNSSL